jgi:hypothetical protein
MKTVTEASRNFSDLVSRVHYQGESTLLIKGRPAHGQNDRGEARKNRAAPGCLLAGHPSFE